MQLTENIYMYQQNKIYYLSQLITWLKSTPKNMLAHANFKKIKNLKGEKEQPKNWT